MIKKGNKREILRNIKIDYNEGKMMKAMLSSKLWMLNFRGHQSSWSATWIRACFIQKFSLNHGLKLQLIYGGFLIISNNNASSKFGS